MRVFSLHQQISVEHVLVVLVVVVEGGSLLLLLLGLEE